MENLVKTVKLDSFSMRYFSFGSGEKTFVIIPGLSVKSVMESAGAIKQAYDIIAREYKVYVFDIRNELPPSYSVSDMAKDTAKAFEKLNLSDVYLFGASMGGMISLEITLRYPKLVKKLMLGSTAPRIREEYYKTFEKWFALANEKKSKALYLEMSSDIYPKEFFEKYKDVFEKFSESVTQEDLERFTILIQGIRGFDISDELINISRPVLAIGSQDDKVFPGATEEIIRLLSDKSDFEYHLYSSYSHSAYDLAPDYKERLLEFMKKE